MGDIVYDIERQQFIILSSGEIATHQQIYDYLRSVNKVQEVRDNNE